LTKSLLDLFKKELSFTWKKEQQKTFEDLKEKLLSTLVLKFINFIKPFEIHINAKDFDIDGVFM
jgi:hypothetical protein